MPYLESTEDLIICWLQLYVSSNWVFRGDHLAHVNDSVKRVRRKLTAFNTSSIRYHDSDFNIGPWRRPCKKTFLCTQLLLVL